MAKRGRPAKPPSDVMTLDQAVQKLKEYLLNTYNNPELAEKMSLSKRTLYNKIWKKELHRYGKSERPVLVSFEEVKRLVS